MVTSKCSCGRDLDGSNESPYSIAQYDKGEMVYAICVHGVLVIDNRDEERDG